MKVWTIANQKGGVGKTTTSVTLGGLLVRMGMRTLMIDIDPHASLTSYFRYDPDALEESVYSLFKAVTDKHALSPDGIIQSTGIEGLDLMPAVMALATLDRQAGRLEGMGLVLKEALTLLETHYDYAIIDCPPILGVLMINALAACERLVIPVQTEFLALKGLERMLNTLQMVFKSRRMDLPYTIVPTMYDVRTRASKQSLKLLRESHAEHIWQGLIPIDTRFRDASRAGVPPDTFDPNARGVVAYDRLLQYLQQGHRQRVSRLAV